QSAKCLVGGLRPIGVPAGNDQTAVDLKQLGISIEVLPCVLDDNSLRLELRCGASALDSSHFRGRDGQVVPGIRNHEIDVGLELRVGQTAVLACTEAADQHAADIRQTSLTDKKKDQDDNV